MSKELQGSILEIITAQQLLEQQREQLDLLKEIKEQQQQLCAQQQRLQQDFQNLQQEFRAHLQQQYQYQQESQQWKKDSQQWLHQCYQEEQEWMQTWLNEFSKKDTKDYMRWMAVRNDLGILTHHQLVQQQLCSSSSAAAADISSAAAAAAADSSSAATAALQQQQTKPLQEQRDPHPDDPQSSTAPAAWRGEEQHQADAHSQQPAVAAYQVNDHVEAQFQVPETGQWAKTGRLWHAIIRAINEDGTYTVEWQPPGYGMQLSTPPERLKPLETAPLVRH